MRCISSGYVCVLIKCYSIASHPDADMLGLVSNKVYYRSNLWEILFSFFTATGTSCWGKVSRENLYCCGIAEPGIHRYEAATLWRRTTGKGTPTVFPTPNTFAHFIVHRTGMMTWLNNVSSPLLGKSLIRSNHCCYYYLLCRDQSVVTEVRGFPTISIVLWCTLFL